MFGQPLGPAMRTAQGNTEIKSARKGALIRGKLPNRGGRDHSLLARQFKSELRRCSRSRASAFYRSGATPRDLPPCFGDYRAYRHRCVFQSSPQTSCFTPAHFSESGQSQTPVGNGCFALAQGRQSRSSQAPVASAMITGKSSPTATRLRPTAHTMAGAAAVAMATGLRPIS